MKPGLISLLAFWSILLYSCKEVSFREPQPAGITALTEIPTPLHGIYLAQEDNDPKADTLIIESWGYHFKDSNEKDWLGKGTLSDSLVVKFYQNYYFVNFLSGDQWVLRLLRQKEDGNLEFMSIDLQGDEKSKSTIKKLSKKMKVTEVKRGEDTFYQLNPTSAQLMTLIKEGFFTGVVLKKKADR